MLISIILTLVLAAATPATPSGGAGTAPVAADTVMPTPPPSGDTGGGPSGK